MRQSNYSHQPTLRLRLIAGAAWATEDVEDSAAVNLKFRVTLYSPLKTEPEAEPETEEFVAPVPLTPLFLHLHVYLAHLNTGPGYSAG